MASKNEIQIIINAVDKASKKLTGVSKALGGLGKVSIAAGAAVAGAVAGVSVAAYKLAKDAAPIEGIKNAFEGLTESIEGGSDRMLDALKRGSYGMVNQTDLMKSFNTAAQLVSKDFAQQMPEAMRYLSKVAAATGEDMSYMIDSMVKGVGRLSPMILDNLGIQVDATQAYEDFAAANGLVASELNKTQQQAALMNQVMEKLKLNTADMPEVAGTAAQAFASFRAQMDDLKSEIGLKLLPLFERIVEALQEAFASEDVQQGIDNLIDWIGKVVGDENSGLIGIVTYLSNGNVEGAFDLAFGVGAWDKVNTFITNFNQGMKDIKKFIDDVKQSFIDWRVEIYLTGLKLWYFSNQALRALHVWNQLIGALTGQPIQFGGPGFIEVPDFLKNGFASGGSFIVPGTGSGDRPYTMGLTPGERVTVTPRGQVGGGGLFLTVNINSAVNLADRNYAERELMPYIEAGVRRLLAGAG